MSCTTINKECLSCLPSPYSVQNIYFPFNSSCVNACPDTYYLILSSNSCGKCNQSACYTCSNNDSYCSSCINGKFLYNNTCVSICPTGFYGLNNECQKCSSPCLTCNGSAAYCLTCISNYFIDIGTSISSCVQTCTNVNYLGVDGICKQCTSNCKTCKGTLGNCTSCD